METKAPTMTNADALQILTAAYPYAPAGRHEADAPALAALFNNPATGPELRRLFAVKRGPNAASVYLEARRFMIKAANAADLYPGAGGAWCHFADRLPAVWPARFQ